MMDAHTRVPHHALHASGDRFLREPCAGLRDGEGSPRDRLSPSGQGDAGHRHHPRRHRHNAPPSPEGNEQAAARRQRRHWPPLQEVVPPASAPRSSGSSGVLQHGAGCARTHAAARRYAHAARPSSSAGLPAAAGPGCMCRASPPIPRRSFGKPALPWLPSPSATHSAPHARRPNPSALAASRPATCGCGVRLPPHPFQDAGRTGAGAGSLRPNDKVPSPPHAGIPPGATPAEARAIPCREGFQQGGETPDAHQIPGAAPRERRPQSGACRLPRACGDARRLAWPRHSPAPAISGIQPQIRSSPPPARAKALPTPSPTRGVPASPRLECCAA